MLDLCHFPPAPDKVLKAITALPEKRLFHCAGAQFRLKFPAARCRLRFPLYFKLIINAVFIEDFNQGPLKTG
ncbi:hypothetical protein BEN74_11195 [Acinetobacter sp. WCHAc010034]|nr:hypothetical protein BEN74_11195 [Acinetobacter sp. WCHAc010034]